MDNTECPQAYDSWDLHMACLLSLHSCLKPEVGFILVILLHRLSRCIIAAILLTVVLRPQQK